MKMSGDFLRGTFRRFFKRWYDSWMQARKNEIVLDKFKKASDIELREMKTNALRIIPPDQNARLGVAWDGQRFRDLDSRAVYTMVKNEFFDPINERLDRVERLMIAAGPNGATKAAEMLPAPEVARLPEHIPLRSLVDTPSVHNLVLGVSAAGIVRADMEDLVHVAVGGSSGWGKSIFLRSIVYQLAKSADRVDLILIDLEKTTFSPFYNCDRLLYPVIDDEDDAIRVFAEIRSEMDRRKMLYEEYPGVDSLSRYNSASNQKLDPYVVAIDEGTALLNDKRVEKTLRTLALRARKFGIWFLFGGQDWKATSVDSTIKYQFSTSIQFKAKSGPQSRALLGDSCAKDIHVQGRAFAVLPGREMIELQAPIIGHQDIISAMTGNGPRYEMPESVVVVDHSTAVINEVIDLKTDGKSDTAIARIVFGYGTMFYIEKVRAILQQQHK